MTPTTAPAAGSLRGYFALEARHAPRRTSLVAAIAGVLVVLGTHALLVRVPAQVIRFLRAGLRDRGDGRRAARSTISSPPISSRTSSP